MRNTWRGNQNGVIGVVDPHDRSSRFAGSDFNSTIAGRASAGVGRREVLRGNRLMRWAPVNLEPAMHGGRG